MTREDLSEIDLDCIERYKEILKCDLTYEEYIEIDKHIDCMILDYETEEAFLEDYIWLYGYREWSEKLRGTNKNDDSMLFLVSKNWLLGNYFSNDEQELKKFMSEYTAEDTLDIYSWALLNDVVVFECIERLVTKK